MKMFEIVGKLVNQMCYARRNTETGQSNIWKWKDEVPIAPASSKASACTNPSPRAAPETSTTFPAKLNSDRRFVVPRNVDVPPVFKASSSADGGDGALVPLRIGCVVVKVRTRDAWGNRKERAARGRIRRVVFILVELGSRISIDDRGVKLKNVHQCERGSFLK
jgi:hypothetical protein